MTQGVRLTQEQIDAIAESLEVNPTWRGAAIHAGVNESTLYDYRNRAESYTKRIPDLQDETDPDRYYHDAVQTWLAALGRLEMRCARGILEAGPKDWKAYDKILKVLAPQDWNERLELTGAGGGPIQVSVEELTARAEEALERRAQSDPSAEASPAGNDE